MVVLFNFIKTLKPELSLFVGGVKTVKDEWAPSLKYQLKIAKL